MSESNALEKGLQNPVTVTKKDLRARGWSARDIKSLLVPTGVVKGAGRGRPSFTYALSDVELIEQQADAFVAETNSVDAPLAETNGYYIASVDFDVNS